MTSWCCGRALYSCRRAVVCQGEYKSIREPYKQKPNHEPQTPIRQFPCWKRRRGDLNQESCGDDVSRGDTINLSPLQLLEEAAHDIGLSTLIIISCRLSYRQIPVQKRCAPSMSTQTTTSQKADR